jgi:hypothetical protein
MEHAQMTNPNPKYVATETCPRGQALDRWQDLVSSIDGCSGYEFAVMTGLAAPLLPLVVNGSVAINFFGGDLSQRRTLLQLALSSWTDPATLDDDKLTNVSWVDGRTKLGFSYALQAERFSVLDIKNAAANGGSRVAILCGQRALDEDIYLDDSLGGESVYVFNLDIEKLGIKDDLGLRACATADTLSVLSRSYAGAFLMKELREWKPRIRDIRSLIKIQADFEYKASLIPVIRAVRNDEVIAFGRIPVLNLSCIPRMLSFIKAIAEIAIELDVLPDIESFPVFCDIYCCWSQYQIELKQSSMDENVS